MQIFLCNRQQLNSSILCENLAETLVSVRQLDNACEERSMYQRQRIDLLSENCDRLVHGIMSSLC